MFSLRMSGQLPQKRLDKTEGNFVERVINKLIIMTWFTNPQLTHAIPQCTYIFDY